MLSEEEKMLMQQVMEEEDGYLTSYFKVPYFLLEDEVTKEIKARYENDWNETAKLYRIYKKGSGFVPEGSNLDYIPSRLKYKKAAMIINKEARFLFSNAPTFNINVDDVTGEYAKQNAILQDYLDKVIEKTNFKGKLLKGLKDCFIGKRIALVLNVLEDKLSITFLNSLEFIYEMSDRNPDELSKFVSFNELTGSTNGSEQKWFKKIYYKNEKGVYLEEYIYSGNGKQLEVVTPKKKIKFDYIPVAIVLNDGLTGDLIGESELGILTDYEKYYNKLANADMDAERKSMNPIKYTIDASNGSTQNLSTSPGSYWDLQSDDDKAEQFAAKVGTLEAQMNYSGPLKTTLERIENEMYAEVDVPNITSEQLAGVITSGKTIQALYWGLTVRCDEKMLGWEPALRQLSYMIVDAGILYPNCIKPYTFEKTLPVIPYDVIVENNYPIPEDLIEEKQQDISEVEANVMSRKAYLKKWRKLNDEEADSEIEQIKYEYDLLNNSFSYSPNDNVTVDDENLDDGEIDE